MAITDLYKLLFGKEHIQDGDVISMSEHGRVGGVSTGQGFKYSSLVGVTAINTHTGNQELRVYGENHICTQNTTTTPLGANATFTGEWQDCLNYQEVNVSIVADQNSATNGLVFQWSADGINIGDTDTYSYYTASGGTNYTPNPAFRYVRMVYTNGATPQTLFSLQTILRRTMTGGSFHRIDSTLKDDADARLQIVVPKLKTAANTYVSQTATTAGNAKISLEEYDTAFDSAPLPVQIQTAGVIANVEARKQTPTGNALNVQIGPGDIISNIPVVMDFPHHQVHEGETHQAEDYQSTLGAGTVKYSITVPVFNNTIHGPHMVVGADVYGGNVIVQIYEGATFTGGTTLTSYNRNRNSATTPGTTLKTGVTSTNGTLIQTFFAGAGKGNAAATRPAAEFVLKSNTVYRVDIIGRAIGTEAVVAFDWYEDLGV